MMWAECDFPPTDVPRLETSIDPVPNKIYTMFHGTSRAALKKILVEGFKPSPTGMLGRGVYLSRDPNKAIRYPLNVPAHERVLLRVSVNVGRVKKIDSQGHYMQKTWHQYDYDTAWCPPNCGMVASGLEEDCVWDPSRITITGIKFLKMEAE
ncbi:hypothetical protein ACEWY4_008759 [Coilia grayii]|uniref:PARP catalytic domain-containing protein n=1 Tax=Coilia grayii TaxID=363190 RepID=A0ABD1KBQ1_9TELE